MVSCLNILNRKKIMINDMLSYCKQLITGKIMKWHIKQIEEGNIIYGNIENCNIDTNLTSKIWRLVTSKKAKVTSNLSSTYLTSTVKTGSNGVKRGHSIPYHHQQSPPHPTGDPVWPCLIPFLLSMLNKSMINSMLPFSMLTLCRC